MGTAQCSILGVQTKLLKVFVTGVHPSTRCEDVTQHLQERMKNKTVKSVLIKEHEHSKSFCVTAQCLTVDEIYDANLWPEGVTVRRFYDSRKITSSSR